MDRKKLAIRVVFLIFFILFLNFIAMQFHWYYLLWWLDMPMHFLGGFWLVLASILFYPKWNASNFILKITLFSLLIFIFWEIFQIIVKNGIGGDPFDLQDTLSDICFDLAGGLTAVFYFLKKIKLNSSLLL